MTSPLDSIFTPRNPVAGWFGNVQAAAKAHLVVTPTISASLVAPPRTANAHLTVDPNIVASMIKHAQMSAHLTVTPTIRAVLSKPGALSAVLSVTPTLHAALTRGVKANAHLTVTPTFSASATVSTVTAPVFDAAGSGAHTSLGSTLSGTHTATAGATVFAFVLSGNASTVSATYGGTSMTSVDSVEVNNAGPATLHFFQLSSAPSGSQTVSVTLTGSTSASFGTVSYTGVTSVGTPSTTFGSSASPSQALTCSANQLILECIGTTQTISSDSGGTSRFKSTTTQGVAIQDSTTSTTFGATLAASAAWAAIGVVLL
jgi:hypothetical protein